MVYETYEELKNNDLKLGDKIIFKYKNTQYFYEVYPTFLCCCKIVEQDGMETKGPNNDIIFSVLGIQPDDFCKMYYIKCPDDFLDGIFPFYCEFDFQSAKNVVLALFLLCNDLKCMKNIWED